MHETHERARYYLTLPDDDPRFGRMRAVLDAVQRRGRKSPISRMLAEWALLGFALQAGLLVSSQDDTPLPVQVDAPDHGVIVEQQRAIEEAMAAFSFD